MKPRLVSFRLRAAGALALAGLAAFAAAQQARAQAVESASERYPVSTEQRRVAEQVAAAGVPLSALAPQAPERYTVKSGDTLWGLSSLYLSSPWRWPELWGMNQQQVRNPHLIYPGQTLLLIKGSDGRARLALADGGAAGPGAGLGGAALPGAPGDTVRLSPRVRDLGAQGAQALPSIPNNIIEPFLSQPLVLAASELDRTPRIVATPEGRVYLGSGDIAYARGFDDTRVDTYQVFRPARPLFDPDDTARKTPIAYEAFYVGTARIEKRGEVSELRIQESRQEMGVGDRLLPLPRQQLVSYVPHRPERPIEGRIVSVYGGVGQAGTQSIVTLNRGKRDGVEVGHVLGMIQVGATLADRTAAKKELIKLPDERIGEIFVFRVFDSVSYALVMRVTQPVNIGDRFALPDGPPGR